MTFNNIADTSQENEDYEFVSYKIIPACDLAVLTLSSCKYNEEYKECLKTMFTEVKEKGINNVCVDLTDNNLGTIIGEASGNRPNSYGDVTLFKLPNSGLVMQVSTKKWYRVDAECLDEFIEPDVKCESSQALDILKSICEEH